MAKHRAHSIEFKRQIAQDFIAGETLHALAKRHDISRNLIRIWVRKFEAGDKKKKKKKKKKKPTRHLAQPHPHLGAEV